MPQRTLPFAAATILLSWATAFALPVSGSLPTDVSQIVMTQASKKGLVTSASGDSNQEFTIQLSGGRHYLGLRTTANQYLPVILAVRKGKRLTSVAQALSSNLCSSGKATGLPVLQSALKGATFTIHKSGEIAAFASLSGYKKKLGKKKLKLSKIADTKRAVKLDPNCMPLGNALNQGLGTSASAASKKRVRALLGDSDSDGLPDLFDSDTDGDGILNPYDGSFTAPFFSFQLFSNLKVGIIDTVNSNTGVTPTKEAVDALLSNASTLAVEVKSTAGSGEVAELDCGTLGYCTTGGTGTVANTADSFPGPLGGTYDPDSDGLGTITRGPTNDFQLRTGASLSSINSGDSFIQIVTDSSGRETKYFRKLDFVFKGTPAIKSVVVNPSSTSPSETTMSYPVPARGPGTPNVCIPASPDGSGNLIIQLTAWRPQRGAIRSGEPEFVDLGKSEITVDIPSKPCTVGSTCSTTRMPNNCSASTYTEADTNLEITGGKLVDTRDDAPADSAETLTFAVDLNSCLAESGDALDPGEEVTLDLQFRSVSSTTGSDNAAVKFCLRRPALSGAR